MKALYKWMPLLVLIVISIAVYSTGVHHYLSFMQLKQHREDVLAFVAARPLLSPLLFTGGYALVVALSIPVAMFLSVLAGFLFPQPLSTLYVVTGATTGASCIFMVAKSALGSFLKSKAGAHLKLYNGFNSNRISYLLLLRLAAIVPFWVANVVPAFFDVPLNTFIWTTALGILPGAFAFTQAGTGLGAILDSGEAFSINSVLNFQMRIALAALALLVLLPIFIRRLIR